MNRKGPGFDAKQRFLRAVSRGVGPRRCAILAGQQGLTPLGRVLVLLGRALILDSLDETR